jgi:hypothetical protein
MVFSGEIHLFPWKTPAFFECFPRAAVPRLGGRGRLGLGEALLGLVEELQHGHAERLVAEEGVVVLEKRWEKMGKYME